MPEPVTVFKVGDVVQLKSGSPKMTIISVNDDAAYCNWFGEERTEGGKTYYTKACGGSYILAALKKEAN